MSNQIVIVTKLNYKICINKNALKFKIEKFKCKKIRTMYPIMNIFCSLFLEKL